MFIGWESTTNNTQGCYYGIKIEDATEVNEIKNANQVWSDISDSLFPFGKDYFWSKEGSSNDQRWWRWDQWPTLEAMINGSYMEFIKDKSLHLKQRNLMDNLFFLKTVEDKEAAEKKLALIDGKLETTELLSLRNTSVFKGEMSINKLSIEPGAIFNGTCNMPEKVAKPQEVKK